MAINIENPEIADPMHPMSKDVRFPLILAPSCRNQTGTFGVQQLVGQFQSDYLALPGALSVLSALSALSAAAKNLAYRVLAAVHPVPVCRLRQIAVCLPRAPI